MLVAGVWSVSIILRILVIKKSVRITWMLSPRKVMFAYFKRIRWGVKIPRV